MRVRCACVTGSMHEIKYLFSGYLPRSVAVACPIKNDPDGFASVVSMLTKERWTRRGLEAHRWCRFRAQGGLSKPAKYYTRTRRCAGLPRQVCIWASVQR